MHSGLFDFAPEVQEALARKHPVVALETTILSHGMPYPDNVATAREVERIVRAAGAVPATIALIGGRIRIGLSDLELEHIGTSKDVLKLSRADLPFAVACGKDGATTVAATMLLSALAGITVFATGGIGGVHRGAEQSMDVSADLEELARTPVTVVCAGAKALLDLPKTIEVLETLGVPVIGYGVDEFPAFWSRASGLPVPMRLDTPSQVANFVRVQRLLGISAGALIANPIPVEREIARSEMAVFIDQAVRDAQQHCISGKSVTPWLLSRLLDITGGRSLVANVDLIKNNAHVAAQIAVAVAAAT
ncbi:MAG: pseudouridine-5'-phosphate glycosidase [Candidatus Eremiobacteraeota bacterium]|nr:pseudouridine-5'-phosphate glycosidase [Candidatus Eremiobacteraeota bacterium]